MAKSTKEADEKIVQEAKDRFKRCKDWESTARQRSIDDMKFCEGDSDNGYQWDAVMMQRRISDPNGPRPTLTINKTRQHCLQIVNDARQNKAQIEIRPVGDGATYEAAKIFEGVVRHIEYISNAPEIYDSATWQQVTAGWGYWRVVTDYVDDKSFDQEIYLRRVPDRLSVYLDPDIQEFDGSDARFSFVFRDIPRDQFETEFPAYKDELGDSPLDNTPDAWDSKDHVRVAEYYRKSNKKERILALSPEIYDYLVQAQLVPPLSEGGQPTIQASDLPKEWLDALPEGSIVNERETTRVEIEWFKIAGEKIVDRNVWPGIYIPLVRVVGEETIIDGQLDRKGHTRALKDAQRMYNYWTSAAAEQVALQGKSPYITPVKAVEGLETYWNNANTENYAYLPYNHIDENGAPLQAPARQMPPQMSQAYLQGMQTAQTELMMASGQWQAQMGQNENAKSGIAIQERQRQGDNATYHYIDHLAQAIRYTGRILIDLVPKIYDTPRIVKIMAEDGDQTEVHVMPDAPAPKMDLVNGQPASPDQVKQAQSDDNLKDKIQTIFNPSVGRYDVVADVGPGYATRRQEAFNALTQIMAQNPEVFKVAGDLMFAAADFPMADELAERFKRLIPKQVLGEGPPPEMEQMQQQHELQMQGMQQILQKVVQESADAKQKLKQKDEAHDLSVYQAETQRLNTMASADPDAAKVLFRSWLSEMVGMPIVPAMAAHAHAEAALMPQEESQEQTVQ